MARNRVKLGSLTYQIQKVFDEKLGIGESKHLAKINGTANQKIYSWDTYKTYMQQANSFAKYCKDHYECKTLDECKKYINNYMEDCIKKGHTASTQKVKMATFAKLYNCSSREFGIKTNVRHRAEIIRSRGVKIRDKHFSYINNIELIKFCRATGLRRAELAQLRGTDLILDKTDNKYKIHVTRGSKGGRERIVPIIGSSEQIKEVIDLMNIKNETKIFDKIPNGADIHSYRADYATEYYKQIARDIKDIPFDKINKGTNRAFQSEVYICRSDLKGVKYDKVAMLEVSKALGHNRISIIAEHYLKSTEI
ncbi:MAG: integrase domain-containing protein [Clostridium sp.]|uniref:integrase domain-containing protein n=1 Tax=Clostridium sp. TaxID=1506 RepID=UPI003EE819FB